MTECDVTNFQISLVLQIVTVILTTLSAVMLGVRCKCKSRWGEFNLKPRGSPLTPPDVVDAAKPDLESGPLVRMEHRQNPVTELEEVEIAEHPKGWVPPPTPK